MGELIGYGRVSSRSQSLDIQIDALTAAGVASEHLYLEKASGRKREGRACQHFWRHHEMHDHR